ncbi:SRPBCC family protein [Verminephrobacter aporrectodeae]|nr:hypothetical protein [Verminephrobacter aporrectodeae]
MVDTVKFHSAYTATADASMQDVWAIWVDVNHWMQWDKAFRYTQAP